MSKLWAIWARTTAAPAAVVPAEPKRAPRSLTSISAKKLSDGVLVRETSVAIGGEWTVARLWRCPGRGRRVTLTCRGTTTPAAFSAATSC